ncbi:MAG: hypothetical protein HYU66_24950 [Armatimonadetes bacterium]|nr:hypothetical protein [Armatimonadota bacterium]
MMAKIHVEGVPGGMQMRITGVPAFPGESFGVTVPEAIGDYAATAWPNVVKADWETTPDGLPRGHGVWEGQLEYTVAVTASEETVDLSIELTNRGPRTWEQSLAFTCFQCGVAPSIRDHECLRHFVSADGAVRRLVELPRAYGARPTVQLYSVQGAPAARDIPFVVNVGPTPDITLEGWMAIRSRDGKRLVAVASKPALFLFQNMEYSCIHSCPSFGRLEPGQTGRALTRLYFVESDVETWRNRMLAELG